MKGVEISLMIVIPVVAAQCSFAWTAEVNVEEVVRATETFLEELNEFDELSLAVMITKDGVPVLQKAYGLANRSFNAPNKIDTKFNIASMNKMFTAVAIMQLVERGRLGLNDKVGDHIRDYPNNEVKNNVTVYELLTHTSGMGNIFGSLYSRTPVNKFQSVEDYLPLFVGDPLRFAPGTKYEYSNAGYILLGYLLERITGQDYHSYVSENILVPAGMENTDCYDVQYPIPDLAVGYSRSKSTLEQYEYKSNEYMKMTKGGPAGGGYSTVEDLIRFGEALFGNVLLNDKYTDMTTSGKVRVDDVPQGGEYCFGFLEQIINGHRIVGHSGNFAGIRSSLKIYVHDGISIAVLSNFDRDQGAEELEYFVREQINGETDFTKNYLGTKKTIRDIELKGFDFAAKEYGKRQNDFRPYEVLIDSRGSCLLEELKYDKALQMLRFNVLAFPNSAGAYDSLAEAYVRIGDEENAIKHYKRALELDPKLESALEGLEELGVSK